MTSAACRDWNEDPPSSLPRIVTNVNDLWPLIERTAMSRDQPTLDLASGWHRQIYAGVPVPEAQYVGNIRDSDPRHPCLVDYEVQVGSALGVRARDVPSALDSFIRAARDVLARLDAAVQPGVIARDPSVVAAIVRLCAYTHGEWIRIHPFANGNGRTARVWANWIAVRYGLPPFVRIKPRPDDVIFSGAAAMSMRGDHRATESLFVAMLQTALAES